MNPRTEERFEATDLARCPCGGEAVVTDTMPAGAYWCRCSQCGAETGHCESASLAVVAWNRLVGQRSAPGDHSPESALIAEIRAELVRARNLSPGKNVTLAALMEEVGELAKATFEEPRTNVRKEAVQVAVMAMRMVLDGDHTFEAWRAEHGLDHLVDPAFDDGDTRRCLACQVPLTDGVLVHYDASGDLIHAACCGPDRAAYFTTGDDGTERPLQDGEPIPEPWAWHPDVKRGGEHG